MDFDDADWGHWAGGLKHRTDGKRDDHLLVDEHADDAAEQRVRNAHSVRDGTLALGPKQGAVTPESVRHRLVVLTCVRSYDLRVQVFDTNRAYAVCVGVLALAAALCYLLDAGLIDRVMRVLR